MFSRYVSSLLKVDGAEHHASCDGRHRRLRVAVCRRAAATEADRRECATHQDSEAKIAACTRIADDKSSAPGLLTLAYRNRGIAYGNKGLHELANFDFNEALKLSPEDRPSLYGRGRSYAPDGAV